MGGRGGGGVLVRWRCSWVDQVVSVTGGGGGQCGQQAGMTLS